MTSNNNNIRKICFVSGTRADYGLLFWTMKGVINDPAFDFQFCVTGTHLSDKFGHTVDIIERDQFPIDYKIDIEISSGSPSDILHSMSIATKEFGAAFEKLKPDAVFILGDRYEMLAVATAATMCKIPIIHAHGGEITLGAIDDRIRHAITKLAAVHFASTDTYKKRIEQMGAAPEMVHNVGAFGFENIQKLELLDKESLEERIGLKLGEKSAMITFHPETMDPKSGIEHLKNFLEALSNHDFSIIFSYPNADHMGEQMIQMIEEFGKQRANTIVVPSLGQLNYLSALKHVSIVIGNSSSGIIEAPSFKIPTVNIGGRQDGRIAAETVINCGTSTADISAAIEKAMSDQFRVFCQTQANPYEKDQTSASVIEILKSTDLDQALNNSFIDII